MLAYRHMHETTMLRCRMWPLMMMVGDGGDDDDDADDEDDDDTRTRLAPLAFSFLLPSVYVRRHRY